MMKRAPLIMILALFTASCASTREAKREVSQEMKTTAPVQPEELSRQAQEEIAQSPNLTTEQKQKLLELQERTRKETSAMRDDSMKLRSMLVQKVLSDNYNPTEVRVIENQMRDLESRRLSALFRSVDEANTILGRQARTNQNYVSRIMDEYQYRY